MKRPHRTQRMMLEEMSVRAPLYRLATDVLSPLPLTPEAPATSFLSWITIPSDQMTATCSEVIMNKVIECFGCPLTLHSDQDRN